jgi:hypothetical protein
MWKGVGQLCGIQHLLGDPYYVSDNGSCLFNVVSVALCGTEDLAVELCIVQADDHPRGWAQSMDDEM